MHLIEHQLVFMVVFSLLPFLAACGDSGDSSADGAIPVFVLDGDQTVSDGDQPDNQTDGDFLFTDGDELDGDGQEDSVDGDEGNTDGDGTEIPVDGDSDGDVSDGDIQDGDTDGDEEVAADGDYEPDDTTDEFCRAFSDCLPHEVCDFSLGTCDRRIDWPAAIPELFTFHPPAASVDDFLVIDGAAFWSNPMLAQNVSISIGDTPVTPFLIDLSGNRLIVSVPEGAGGSVSVKTDTGQTLVSDHSFQLAEEGLLDCTGDTPYASEENGVYADQTGPHAAGYLDMPEDMYRVYYPAECGSIRRPAIPGTYPLVMLLHGNGATWIAYDYLGQFLATWGFVSVMTYRDIDFGGSEPTVITDEQIATGLAIIRDVRGVDLGNIHPVLEGVYTTENIALVGHSRGAAFAEEMFAADADLHDHGVATVFVGPVDDLIQTPGAFMVFGASKDAQSSAFLVNLAYNRQISPKWKIWINGGNHSLYTDHHVWFGLLDGQPLITRQTQLSIVSTFTLPFFERAFGLTEHFPWQLDNPPLSPNYTVEHQ